MNWNFTSSSDTCYNTSGITGDLVFDTTTTTWDLPDPLIDWFPYKWKKYLPTWHLVRSYK